MGLIKSTKRRATMSVQYQVTTPLRDTFVNHESEYGSDSGGALRRVDFRRNGVPHAVLFRAGGACLDLAMEEASSTGGAVEVVR